MKEAEREILLSLWKVHILHHAGEKPIHGQWILEELREHGYDISPGTLYPLLERMTRRGWLRGRIVGKPGPRARRNYSLTSKGGAVLALVRERLKELYREVIEEAGWNSASGLSIPASRRNAPGTSAGLGSNTARRRPRRASSESGVTPVPPRP